MMKHWYWFLGAVFLFACKRTEPVKNSGRTGLTGKWIAVEYYMSPGFGGSWYPLAPPNRFTVEFRDDSSFGYSPNFPKADSGFVRYSLNNTEIRVRNAANTKTDTWYHNPNPGDTLALSLVVCFEGCPYGLRRAD